MNITRQTPDSQLKHAKKWRSWIRHNSEPCGPVTAIDLGIGVGSRQRFPINPQQSRWREFTNAGYSLVEELAVVGLKDELVQHAHVDDDRPRLSPVLPDLLEPGDVDANC